MLNIFSFIVTQFLLTIETLFSEHTVYQFIGCTLAQFIWHWSQKENHLFGKLPCDVYSRNVLLERAQTASSTAYSITGACCFYKTHPIGVNKSDFSLFCLFFGLRLSSVSGIYDLFVLAPNAVYLVHSRCACMLVELNCGTKCVFCNCWFTLSKTTVYVFQTWLVHASVLSWI